MPPSRYPKAVWLGNGVSGGSYTSGPWKLVLHTTETAGVPNYNDGKYAPHVTYYPTKRRFYQHTDFSTAARALKNESGGVQTNRDSAIQLEIVAYSDERMVDEYGGGRIKVSELRPEHLQDIREFIDWVCAEFGVQKVWPGRQALSYSQANNGRFRMSPSEWDGFNGICGHQHLPENTHWDPGALNWNALLIEEDVLAYEKPGDPIESISDANAVFGYQGSIFAGSNVASYLMGVDTPEFRRGVLVGLARMVDMFMQFDQRIRQVDGQVGERGPAGPPGEDAKVEIFVNGERVA